MKPAHARALNVLTPLLREAAYSLTDADAAEVGKLARGRSSGDRTLLARALAFTVERHCARARQSRRIAGEREGQNVRTYATQIGDSTEVHSAAPKDTILRLKESR